MNWLAIPGILSNLWKQFGPERRKLSIYQEDTSSVTQNVSQVSGIALTAVAFTVTITNNSPSSIIVIRDFKVSLPWDDEALYVLRDPAEVQKGGRYKVEYTLIDHARDEVLNHRRHVMGK